MNTNNEIRIWNRAEKREEVEKVYGEGMVRWLYGTPPGRSVADHLLSRAWVSHLYGSYQGSSLSQHKIEPFIRDYQIPMHEFEEGPFRSFNDFFIRKFKPGARRIETDPTQMPAFAEARYLAYESIQADQTFPVKGQWLSAEALLGSTEKAKPFMGGPLLLARLCPTDYHRFHYPAAGQTLDHYRVAGRLHSVNPFALRYRGEIFVTNERQISVLETADFGRMAYIEVGALCVGRIVQTHAHKTFARGDEKGYFLFGASTVIVLGEPGAWHPDGDLLAQTAARRETLVRLGEAVAHRSGVAKEKDVS